MKTVVIAGGSGTVGQRLQPLLHASGFRVLVLTTREALAQEHDSYLYWHPRDGIMDEGFAAADVIINLAGTGIADRRWTGKRKKEILDSRVDSTRFLIRECSRRAMQLDHFLSASAIGYYGDGSDRWQTEEDGVMTKEFLSDVCQAWEVAAQPAKEIAKCLTVLRIATVLSPTGGALEKMNMTVPMGIASYFGDGQQWMSWIHLEDLCQMIRHCILHSVDGIYNATAPQPINNKDFMRILKGVVQPKALLVPTPRLALQLSLGELSRLILNSNRVSSDKIRQTGFQYQYGELENALYNLLIS